jgi:hypothetical protein
LLVLLVWRAVLALVAAAVTVASAVVALLLLVVDVPSVLRLLATTVVPHCHVA